MNPHETPISPTYTHPVVLIEGERDRKPRPEAYVNWPEGIPPGGPIPRDGENPTDRPQSRQHTDIVNPYRKRFLIKIAGAGDQPGELDEEPLTETVLSWLASELNREQTPLMINAPCIGSRGPKKAPLSITEYAGYVAKNTARFDASGQDGAGLYAVVEVMPDWIALIGAMVNSPAGIDFTAYPPNSIKSLDVVVRPRGTGKVVAQLHD